MTNFRISCILILHSTPQPLFLIIRR
uniref:Uncharacterized protein n=1 Tax=Anguilla anguilla TaxID=7936 RepID=A0A0E9T974_ANGAN